jgi:predicted ATPase
MGDRHEAADGPAPSDVREQLRRMLGQAPLDRSPVLSRFLAHVVEHALASGAPPLKEYAVGLEVFDRPDDFDPRVDTIVRVQARRLRDALARYYRDHGSNDPVRLDMPKGQYGIRVSWLRSGGSASSAPVREPGSRTAEPVAAAALPVPRTPLIGREEEIEQLAQRLGGTDVRLLSITGVGGSGKTRLALAAADAASAAYPGGVMFIDLASVSGRSVLIDMLADVFNVRSTRGQSPLEALVERMRNRLSAEVLLVLDNMEGVLDGADVLGRLLDASPQLTILVTSRAALHLYGEHEFPLAPLAVPGPERAGDDALAAVPSVRLFLARALAANPHADCGCELDAVADLCVRLDGLPLAIELVAAQAVSLTPRQMLERFSGHLDLPENPARDAPSRQRTLRRTIDWSHDLLDAPARCLLRRLSVFAGGFTLEAAQAVADADGGLGDKLMPAVNTLLAMGMLYFRNRHDEPRLAMLETLRTYGLERLAASGESDAVRKAHAAYCVVLAEEGVSTLDTAQREDWLKRCDLEQDNFRQALEYLLRQGPPQWTLRLGHALFAYWERREKLVEARRALQRILDGVPSEPDTALWAKVGTYVAVLAAFQGEHEVAREQYRGLLDLYRRMGDRKGEAAALNALGVTARFGDREDEAREWFRAALELCRQIGDRSEIAAAMSNLAESELRSGNAGAAQALLDQAHAMFMDADDPVPAAWCLNHLGDVAHAEGDMAAAADHYARAETAFSQLGDAWGLARSRADRGRLALERGELEPAASLLLRALTDFEALDHQRGMATVVDGLADYALTAGDAALAVKLLGAADGWRRAVGFRARCEDMRGLGRVMSRIGGSMDPAELRILQAAGARMTPADVAAALGELTRRRC